MNWIAFHFGCRFFYQKLLGGKTISEANILLKKNYDDPQLVFDQELPLWQKIFNVTDSERLTFLLNLYGKLDLSWPQSQINKLYHLRSYLFFVSIIFLLISVIYQSFVFPSFIALYEEINLPIGYSTEKFNTILTTSIFIIIIINISLLRFSFLIKKMMSYPASFSLSLLDRVILSSSLVKSMQHIQALVYAPLDTNLNELSTKKSSLIKQLTNDNLNVPEEMQYMLKAAQGEFLRLVNKRIIKLVTMLAVIIVSVVAYFIIVAYSHIFALGEIV